MPGLFDTPQLGPCLLTPRPFQARGLEAVREEFRRGIKRTMLVHATGTGKGPMIALATRWAIDKGNRVLCLAQTDELIQQLVDKIDRAGVEPAVEQAGQFSRSMFEPQAVVGSVMSMKQTGRLMSFPENYFDLINVDECHHVGAGGEKGTNSYKRIASRFPKAKIIGYTASPKRGDDVSLGGFFESVADTFTIFDAWEAGKQEGIQYLCDIVPIRLDIDIDLRKLKKQKGDFTDRDVDDRVSPMIEMICNKVAEKLESRPTIAFWGSIRTAELFAKGMRDLGFSAEAVWGNDPERDAKLQRYRDGETQILSNMNLLCEGVDVPSTAAVILGRPTSSWTLYLQQVGRGTRPGKPNMLLIDFNYMTDQFGPLLGLVQPSDLVVVDGFDEELAQIYAELLAPADGTMSMMDAIEKAKEEKEIRVEARKQYAIRMSIQERKVECGEESFSVQEAYFDGDIPTSTVRPQMAEFKPASQRQLDALTRLGYEVKGKMSGGQAGLLIGMLINQKKAGKADLWQRARMIRRGVDAAEARDMSKESAAAVIDGYAATRDKVQGRRRKS